MCPLLPPLSWLICVCAAIQKVIKTPQGVMMQVENTSCFFLFGSFGFIPKVYVHFLLLCFKKKSPGSIKLPKLQALIRLIIISGPPLHSLSVLCLWSRCGISGRDEIQAVHINMLDCCCNHHLHEALLWSNRKCKLGRNRSLWACLYE